MSNLEGELGGGDYCEECCGPHLWGEGGGLVDG